MAKCLNLLTEELILLVGLARIINKIANQAFALLISLRFVSLLSLCSYLNINFGGSQLLFQCIITLLLPLVFPLG